MTESSSQRMESPSSAPARRRQYCDDFKRDAVRLVAKESYSFKAAAKAVGVCGKSLRDWHRKFAPPPQPCGDDATAEQLKDEVKRLRRQLRQTELEREILKKATAYFAKESQ